MWRKLINIKKKNSPFCLKIKHTESLKTNSDFFIWQKTTKHGFSLTPKFLLNL